MDFTNSFSVRAPLSAVWEFMLDAEQVTPCVPGAQITEIVDDTHYKGTVKVKLGAVQMTYRGEMEMQANEAEHSIVLRAKGTEARGSGGASGTITSRLSEGEDGVTQVDIESHVDVTGRVAQFGRGIMQDVANRLIKEFAGCLETKLQERTQPAQEESATQEEPATSAAPSPQPPSPQSAAPQSAAQSSSPSGNVAPTSQPSAPATATPSIPPPQTSAPSAPRAGGGEVSPLPIGQILLQVGRSRMAAGLRALAQIIEPK